MSTATELWKKWEGRVVEGKFPLRQWLGGTDHSAVFLTERAGKESQKAAIKLIPSDNLEDARLSRWADAAKLSHPHLIQLFECGRCEIDGIRLVYVVMEYAEENLAEILPLRPLSAGETSEMLRPAVEALAYLHQAGLVHGSIKPSNVLARDNQLKISADGVGKAGECSTRAPTAYDAPEVASGRFSAESDLWSLGAMLVAVLTQKEPKLDGSRERVAVPEAIPQPLREIARQCLMADPKQRGTAGDIVRRLQAPVRQTQAPLSAETVAARAATRRPKRWAVLIVAVALLLIGWIISKFIMQRPPVPAAETRAANPTPAEVPATKSPAPFAEKAKSASSGVTRGSVLQQVLPDISRSAQNTITGRVKVSVQVSVDASGNVAQAKLVSAGPSQYFASHALAAARRWKFNPPQVDGQAAASEWVLRFQFGRGSINVLPSETKP